MEVHQDILTCEHCQKVLSSRDVLRKHIQIYHEKVERVKTLHVCSKCGISVSSKYILMNHEKSDCGRAPRNKCDICGKSYSTLGYLRSHMRIHTGALPHVCAECGKAFRNGHQLIAHSRVHTGARPYVCEVCGKGFSHRETLLTHSSMHTGLKRFCCQGCGERFSCISNLKAHRRSRQDTCALLPMITKVSAWPILQNSQPKSENV